MKTLRRGFPRLIQFVVLAVVAFMVPVRSMAQSYVPATSAICDTTDISDTIDTARLNPEWAPIADWNGSVLFDYSAFATDKSHLPLSVPKILEGWVAHVPINQDQNSQSSTEVSEEETPWNHYTHDYTFKVAPDGTYQYLLASWNRLQNDVKAQFQIADSYSCGLLGASYIGNNTCQWAAAETCPDTTKEDPSVMPQDAYGATCHHYKMEVEWENGAAMHKDNDSANNTRGWGAVPEYVWPSQGDRVWIQGRWIFDCGHNGVSNGLASADSLGYLEATNNGTHVTDYVKYESEIHPPRALVTFRINHTALSQEILNSSGDPYRSKSDEPSSWLPVTGVAVSEQDNATPPWTPPTLIPVTEADIFVSGNGGGANDLCSLVQRSDSSGDCSPYSHTGPVIPIDDYSYIFDIYPPGTNYTQREPNTGSNANSDGVTPFKITPPVQYGSLQWRILDQSSHIPDHTCGPDKTSCKTVDPVLCLIDASTPPPPSSPADQTALADTMGRQCPAVPSGAPTRLRVVLPFHNSGANYFAKSIFLGWDDVPDGNQNAAMRRFQVSLRFDVNQNGRCSICGDGDWRVFVDVGGQWRWISWLFDTDQGIYAFNGGDNVLQGDPLTENGDDDYYQFTRTPWVVDVADGRTIHVAVGGYDSALIDGSFCDTYSGGGCDYGAWSAFKLGISDIFNMHRIGTYEFDLSPGDCASPCQVQIPETKDEAQYTTYFTMKELPVGTAPTTTSVQVGDPHYNSYVSSATPLTLSSSDAGVQDFQYRFHLQGGMLPTYGSFSYPDDSSSSYPVHWTSVNLPANSTSVSVYLNGASAIGDGPYDFQYSAQSVWNLLEQRHTQTVILDSTPPVATITMPTATQYGHSDTITLGYSVSDGTGSGVKSFTPKMDGQTAAQFCGTTMPNCLDNGQTLYLESMSLGTHIFSVDSVDNVSNAGTNSVTFTITVTFASLAGDVNNLQALGCIDNISQSLVAKFGAAQNVYGKGQVQTAINILSAALYEVQAQAGKHIATACTDPNGRQFNPVNLLTTDIQYLEGILAGQLKADPLMGFVVSSSNVAVYGATVNLLNGKTVIAQTTTDSAGFYYFADVSGLRAAGPYAISVVLPKGFKSSSPASVNFTWSGHSVLGNFVLY
ncbi:MAG: carboxypeptidase-like regulatory domain-containing protein [Terriglobales bacterium]